MLVNPRNLVAVRALGLTLYVLSIGLFLRGDWAYAFLAMLLSWPVAMISLWKITPRVARKLLAMGVYAVFWPLAHPLALLRTPDSTYPLRAAVLGIILPVTGISLAMLASTQTAEEHYRTIRDQVARLPVATSPEARKHAALALLNQSPFHAAWWLRNSHAQTFFGPFFRKSGDLTYRPERLDTPDGDFLYLQYLDGDADKPLVIMLHGLEGSKNSFYIGGANHAYHEMGWNTVTMEFRFCSGEINNTSRIYHMGETTDIDLVVRTLAARDPNRPIYISGVSLGGNVVAKWLGEQGDKVPDNVVAAAVISPPFNPAISAPDFHKILFGFYTWNFLRTLKPKALAKADQFPDLIDRAAVEACADFYTYDTIVTAKLHGFRDAEDYWEKVGSHQFLKDIRVPTLLLTSEDDPFNPPETIPREIAETSPWLLPQWATRGGHVGFVSGTSPAQPRFWAEEQTVAFFLAYDAFRLQAKTPAI